MSACLFCQIAAGEIPATVVHDDDSVLAFRDINPQAPVHILVIPKRHLASVADVTSADSELWTALIGVANALAASEGVTNDGYRVVTNIGANGGQTVDHLHLHLLGGRQMTWPPG